MQYQYMMCVDCGVSLLLVCSRQEIQPTVIYTLHLRGFATVLCDYHPWCVCGLDRCHMHIKHILLSELARNGCSTGYRCFDHDRNICWGMLSTLWNSLHTSHSAIYEGGREVSICESRTEKISLIPLPLILYTSCGFLSTLHYFQDLLLDTKGHGSTLLPRRMAVHLT